MSIVALSYKPQPPFAARLAAAAQAGGADEVRRVFNAYLADPANRYADLELQAALAQANPAGKKLLLA